MNYELMMMREKRDIITRPVLLKFGVALALSLGGILYSIFRNKRIKPSQPPPSPRPPSVCSSQFEPGSETTVSKSDHHALQKTPSFCNFDSIPPEKHEESNPSKVFIDDPIVDLSPRKRTIEDKDGFLLPEFNDLVKEYDLSTIKATFSPRKDAERLMSDTESPRGYSCPERDDHEQEIKSLRNLVKTLKEKERKLEMQLLEYYGLKEQETAVMELQNRLRLNNMEAKLFALKIESLQADNRRLEAQVAEYAKVAADLEAARAKIRLLKKKLRLEAEQNKEQIILLQQRVQKLQDEERDAVASDPEIQSKLDRLKDLEVEVEELRNSNYSLEVEKSELGRRLECVQIIATSVLEDEESERLREESEHLRKQNEDLSKEIEQLQADRCTDVEELVYLRWINACLRYELRNYQPGPGKTVARDLSKSLSPKSEEKAKQLILEYANKEGVGDKSIHISEIDSDQWSTSQASSLTDSAEFEDSFNDNSSSSKANKRFFGKLMKLLRGKDRRPDRTCSRTPSLERTISADFVMGTPYSEASSIDGQTHRLRTSSKHSLDSQRSTSTQRNSDVGSLSIYKTIDSIAEGSPLVLDDQRSELMKYAEALKDSPDSRSPIRRRRSISLTSFD